MNYSKLLIIFICVIYYCTNVQGLAKCGALCGDVCNLDNTITNIEKNTEKKIKKRYIEKRCIICKHFLSKTCGGRGG